MLNSVPKNMQFGRTYGINVCMDIFHILSLSIFCPFLDYNAQVGILGSNKSAG